MPRIHLTVRTDGSAVLSGKAKDARGGSIELAGAWTVVPMPATRVEPEPFTAFRGALRITGGDVAGQQNVDVTFVDNLMYEMHLLGPGPAQSIALVCNPPS